MLHNQVPAVASDAKPAIIAVINVAAPYHDIGPEAKNIKKADKYIVAIIIPSAKIVLKIFPINFLL